MIEFYKAGTTDFSRGGQVLEDVQEAKITHEKNGRFDLEFKIPVNGVVYEPGDIFYTEVPYMGRQAFYLEDITMRAKHMEIYAKHVFFMLGKNVTKDLHTRVAGDPGQSIMDRFKAALQIDTPFTFTSTKTNKHIFNKPGYNNALEVLADGKHSILGQWGGVLVRDNWNVGLRDRWGRDTEFLLAKRKNIADLEIENKGSVTTRLYLTTEVDEEEITAVVDSPLIGEYPMIFGEVRETTDESVKTKQDLIEYGERIFENQRIDLPKESFRFDVTPEVREYEFTVDDTALIYYEDYNIYKRVPVASYEYDPVRKRYLEVGFGEKGRSLSQEVGEQVDKDYIQPSFDGIGEYIRSIIGQMDDPTGGIILFNKDPNGNIIEMLIVDNEDLDMAKNIWRFNKQGISHTTGGINGEYNIAITQEGQIVADFIGAGVLNANLIKAGILESLDGSTWIDMETGNFKLGNITSDNQGFRIEFGGESLEDILNKYDKYLEDQGISTGDVPPVDPKINDLWVDTSQVPNVLMVWDGEQWNETGKEFDEIRDELNRMAINIEDYILRTKGEITQEYEDRLTDTNTEIRKDYEQKIDSSKSELETEIGGVRTDLDGVRDDVTKFNTYFDFDRQDGLKIGRENSPLNITISNEQMDFIDNGEIVAYINGQKMYIRDVEVLEGLVVGYHKLEKFDDSITLVKYIGGRL